jgi:hypothetical protein
MIKNDNIKQFLNHLEYKFMIKSFNSQNISNTLWSFATLNYQPKTNLLQLIENEIVNKITSFNSQEIANTLWSFAKLSYQPNPNLLQLMENEIKNKITSFNSQAIANTLWSFAKLSYQPNPNILELMENEIKNKITTFNAQEITNTLWSFATLNYQPKTNLLQLIENEIVNKIKSFNSQAIANTLLSFATLSYPPNPNIISLFLNNIIINFNFFDIVGKIQLHQCILEYDLDIPNDIKDECKRIFIIESNETKSRLQTDVYKYIKRVSEELNIGLYEEERILECGYSVDIYNENKREIIEVNGPTHYVGSELNMKTEMKYKHLKERGYEVKTIKYDEWYKLKEDEKYKYIKDLIKI